MTQIRRIVWVLLGVLTVGITSMNAQPKADQKQGLSPHQQSLVGISALTATGDLVKLTGQLNAGLDAGLTVNEIKEILVQLYAYCGFPRSLNAISTFMAVVEDRKANGIQDKPGRATAVSNKANDKYEQGRKVLEALTKTPQAKPAPGFGEFAPRIDAFLKEHLFADVFASDVLTYQQRELVTISALAAMPGVDSQLQAHVNMGRNTGLTEEQLVATGTLIEKLVSKTQANTLRNVLSIPAAPLIEPDMMVRISEIDIFADHLDEYNAILKEEAAASVQKEPGVLAIFPMSQKEQPTQLRIVELYASHAAYQSHLKTPHFQHYKTATLPMVKSLKLVDMTTLDNQTMVEIFKKIR